MQEVEFIKTLQKAGYSYEEFGRLDKLVKECLYEEFFENYRGKDWPDDPEGFLVDAMDFAEPDDDPQDFLRFDDGEMRFRNESILTVEYFEEEWFAAKDRLYRMVLDVLKVKTAAGKGM